MNRLKSEYNKILTDPPENISAGPINKNYYKWEAQIIGPSNSVYQGAIFKLNIDIPENYPFKPPKIKFETPIFHPNINRYGDICLDTITTNWTPIMSISKVLLSICSLLTDPNPDDPLEEEIANLYKNDRNEFNRKARLFTLENAREI